MFDIFLLQISLFIHWSLAFTVRDLCVCVWLVSGQYTHEHVCIFFSDDTCQNRAYFSQKQAEFFIAQQVRHKLLEHPALRE